MMVSQLAKNDNSVQMEDNIATLEGLASSFPNYKGFFSNYFTKLTTHYLVKVKYTRQLLKMY